MQAQRRSESEEVQASLKVRTCASLLTEPPGVNPKGGDLYVDRAKPVERLVEARRFIDVQIIFLI